MTQSQDAALPWGYRYVKVEPSHFRVEYQINPFMDPSVQPDPARARVRGMSSSPPSSGSVARSRRSPSARTPPTWSTP